MEKKKKKKTANRKNKGETRPWEAPENLWVKSVTFIVRLIVVPAHLLLLNALSAVIGTTLGPVPGSIHFL